ncbi:MAG: hypothetical protein IPG05_03205 [Gemmatimonadetes bacterium]|nr:hypothetical protein [Gemmatimonadota bacterium]
MLLPLALGVLLQAAPFAPMEYPGADPALGERIRTLCPLPTTLNRAALVANEERLAARVRDARRSVTGVQWRELACGRALLQIIDAPSARGSHLMSPGTSWGAGAIDGALRALALAPADRPAGELLALLTTADAEPEDLPRLAALMRAAVDSGVRAPVVLRACSDFAVRSGDAASTHACADTALAAGLDSTWHLLRLTRQAFREGDSLGGVAHFIDGAGAAHDTLAQLDVDWHLQWFVSPAERAAWSEVDDSSRGTWVRDRLIERDVRDGRPPGSRLAEHFARLEHVEKNFRLSIPSESRSASRSKAGVFQGVTETGESTNGTTWNEYRRWQVDFDDRGVIYMRFGAPDKIAVNTPAAGARAYMTWRYDIDGTPMFVTFGEVDYDGSAGTTTLMTGIVGTWQCGLDQWRCSMAERGAIPQEQVQRLREADREYIGIATTKDDNSPPSQRPIHAVAQLAQLWDPVSEEPLAVIAYGLRLGDLNVVKDSAGRESARVLLALARWHPLTAEWKEDSLTREFLVPKARSSETHLTGFATLAGVGGVGSWGLTAAQPDRRWGRAYGTAVPNRGDAVALSSLIVAPESRGLSWVLRSERIYLSPGGTIKRGEPLHLFYQVRAQGAIAAAGTTIEVRSVAEGAEQPAAIQVSFTGELPDGVTGVNRILDLSQLKPGRYSMEVRVGDKTGALLARRTVILDLE